MMYWTTCIPSCALIGGYSLVTIFTPRRTAIAQLSLPPRLGSQAIASIGSSRTFGSSSFPLLIAPCTHDVGIT